MVFFYYNSINVQDNAPLTKGVDPLEVWMICCNLMVFAALTEYGLILFVKFRKPMSSENKNTISGAQKHARSGGDNMEKPNMNTGVSTVSSKLFAPRHQLKATEKDDGCAMYDKAHCPDTIQMVVKKIDLFSLVVFPVAFFLFIIAYVSYYGGLMLKDDPVQNAYHTLIL